MKHQAIGVDIGTTGVKAALIDVDGRLLASATVEYDLHSPHTGWAEEDPADWIAGTRAALRQLSQHPELDRDGIAAIGVSGMVPALVLLDAAGTPVRPSIQQNDARTIVEVAELASRIDQDALYHRTGGYTNQQHIAPRLLWVQRHEPDAWARTKTILGSYDLVTAWLCGAEPATCSLELNWAIESGLYDFRERRWVPELLEAVDLDLSYFPPVHEPTDTVGSLSEGASDATGLPTGIPIVAGSADHIASALAAGLREDGDILIKFGGAGDILYCSAEPITHPSLFIDAHDIPGKFLLNGCMAASGSLVKWYVSEILGLSTAKSTLIELDREAAVIPAGSDGVTILPYFLGEKTPIMDLQARGVIFGLDLSHTRAHLFRATLEAVMYGFRHHVDVLKDAGLHPNRFLATNGGVSSSLWRQIAADVLNEPVTSFRNHPGSVLGVAFVAGKAHGLFAHWEEIDRFLTDRSVNVPDPAAAIRYERGYIIYRDLYRRLQTLFPAIDTPLGV
ncbi:MAG TPA: FGGY family carbohydrate kinase [Thermomicrobiales bacterium]|nr:FGGY family carbohydrate kinase [Thermomicrobiales bacterium]